MARGLASYSQRVDYSGENLIISISNTLAIHKQDVQDTKTLIGRFLGLFSKQIDPGNIKMDGTRLKQLFDLAHSTSPIRLSAVGEYSIDLVSFVGLLSKAKEHLQND